MSERYRGTRRRPPSHTRRPVVAAFIAGLLAPALAGAILLSPRQSAAEPVDLVLPIGAPAEMGQWCLEHNTAAFRATLTSAGRNLLKGCVELWGPLVTPGPSPSPSVTPTISPTPTPTTPAPTTPAPTTSSPTPTTTAPPPTTSPPAPSPSPTPTPTPTPSPTPTPGPTGRACAPFPAMPDASCTGPNPAVTLRSCSIPFNTIVTAGQVIDGCILSGTIWVRANNVVIRNSVILGGRVDTGYGEQTGLVLTDVEIDGQNSDPNGQSAIGDDNYTCIRCNVWRTGRGAAMGDNVTIRDSWFHDFYKTPGAHMSGIGSNGGQHYTVVHNTIDCQETACSGALVMYGDFAQVNDVLIQNNLFASPGSYCTYGGSTGVASGKPYPHGTNIRYLDNRFSTKYTPQCGMYGPVAAWEWNTGNVWTGNAYTTGVPITV